MSISENRKRLCFGWVWSGTAIIGFSLTVAQAGAQRRTANVSAPRSAAPAHHSAPSRPSVRANSGNNGNKGNGGKKNDSRNVASEGSGRNRGSQTAVSNGVHSSTTAGNSGQGGSTSTAYSNSGSHSSMNNPANSKSNTVGVNGRIATVNGRSIPPGEVTRRADGSATLRTQDGRRYLVGRNGNVSTFRGANNTEARFRADGSVHTVRANGMTITHGPGGVQHIVAQRPDHTAIVTNGAGHGYVQRPFTVGNRQFVQRTYYANGHTYSRVYQTYNYHGVELTRYVPIHYYSPAFYGWAYRPWSAPIYYRWGWTGAPWYGYYSSYFAPYPAYPSASLWLTDYLLSTSLAQSYQEQTDAGGVSQDNAPVSDLQGNQQVVLTPEVKQAVSDEIQRQLALEKGDAQAAGQNPTADAAPSGVSENPASEGLPQTLNDNAAHAFVVDTALEVKSSDGQDCAVTEGDVLQLNGPPAPDSVAAELKVLASKRQDCRQGALVKVSFRHLQDMQNHMRETIDEGLGELEAHQGGLPTPPASGSGEIQTSLASAVPASDPNVAAELKQQLQAANETEQQVISQATAPDSGTPGGGVAVSSPTPLTISLGQSIDEVVASLGNPKQIVNLGAKQIYMYSDMKITFMNARVTDVQ